MPNGTNVFYMEVCVFLEGIQVPCSSVSVSYGIGSPPSCTIVLPASSIIRDLPESTKVHIFFKDLIEDPTTKAYEWRLLFDGELSGWQYTVDGNGAYMSLSAIHSTAYISLMQLLNLDVSNYITNTTATLSGEATLPILLGSAKTEVNVVKRIIEKGGYTTMAQIVVALLNEIIETTSNSATGKFYKAKLGVLPKGWKILKRIYNGGAPLPPTPSGAKKGEDLPFKGVYGWPTDSRVITSDYGIREFNPVTGEPSNGHFGTDIGADYGEPVYASESGTVAVSSDNIQGYGSVIYISHANGESTRYAHLSERLVDFGQRVNKGDTIGKIGSTGVSSGPHLHFEIRDANDSPVNPMSLLPD